ncbi:MAG TPA: MBL fold metallo-hydrolase [Bacteroidales bacterium]|nr:MBL fold metallo-hydrolase [Bacteroidales bacterium]
MDNFAQIPLISLDLFSALYAIEFCSLASGSSGNCYYIGHHDGALLIDAGISARRTEKLLREIGRDIRFVKGILLTHNHIDHIAGLETLAAKHSLNIYATGPVISAVLSNAGVDDHLRHAFVEITPGHRIIIAGFSIMAFEVEHDAPGTIGFHIRNSNASLALATDLGRVGKFASAILPLADILVLEANYDDHMLAHGSYPPYLRQRISSNTGHLGNHQAAAFVAKHCRTTLRHLFLAHLSKENNHPEKVYSAFSEAFAEYGFDAAQLETFLCLDRTKRSAFFRF